MKTEVQYLAATHMAEVKFAAVATGTVASVEEGCR